MGHISVNLFHFLFSFTCFRFNDFLLLEVFSFYNLCITESFVDIVAISMSHH